MGSRSKAVSHLPTSRLFSNGNLLLERRVIGPKGAQVSIAIVSRRVCIDWWRPAPWFCFITKGAKTSLGVWMTSERKVVANLRVEAVDEWGMAFPKLYQQ